MSEVKNEIKEEIEISIFDSMMDELVNSNELEKKGFTVLIYGQGSQSRHFYRQLRYNQDIELYWTGWSLPKALWFLSFIPGQAGLLKIINLKKTKEIYDSVGVMSLCSLYFIPSDIVNEVITGVKRNKYKFDIRDLLKDKKEYFLMDVDFDYHGGEKDGEIFYRILQYGDDLSGNLKRILRIENAP